MRWALGTIGLAILALVLIVLLLHLASASYAHR
jgi:hypothetical protein